MFAKLSPQSAINLKISVDNLFVEEYMPHAPDNFVKVYLLGLSLVSHNIDADNSLERMAKRLNLDTSVVLNAYEYWAEQGIVNIMLTTPMSVEYLPVKEYSKQYTKKFKVDKYVDFNKQLHAMLPKRQILQGEFFEYYSLIESLHMTPEAMLSIISYCVRLKGEDIGYRYILTVARNLAREGILSFDAVNQHLDEIKLYENDILQVFKALKLKRAIDHDDKTMWLKWTKSFGFEQETILAVAKKQKFGAMNGLDSKLVRYHQSKTISLIDITQFETQYENMKTLARDVTRILGQYFEQVGHIVDTYIVSWLSLGFDDNSIKLIAQYCLKRNLRTVEQLNDTINKFYKQGLLTVDNIQKHLQQLLKTDNEIKELLELTGQSRGVISRDRDFYNTWITVWKMPDQVIEHAAMLASTSANPIPYMNTILADWHSKGATTIEQVKALTPPKNTTAKPKQSPQAIQNTTPQKIMSAQELNALFDNLDANDI